MLKKYLYLSILAAFLAFSFNAHASKLRGNTIAGAVLKKDIIKHLNFALPMVSSCKQIVTEHNVVNTKLLSIKGNAEQWSEEWTIRACNKNHKFVLLLTADGQGGTYIDVLH